MTRRCSNLAWNSGLACNSGSKKRSPGMAGPAVLALAVMAVLLACLLQAVHASGGLKGVRIVVDPGHGGWDPGAVGPTGLTEKEVNLRVGTALRNCLVEYGGATVMMTRWGDQDVSLEDRVNMANWWGADRFVSVHHNASTNPYYNGTETYAYTYGSWTSLDMRNKVHQRLVRGLGLPDHGPKTANFYVLRYTRMPAILTEASFITNPYQEARLKDPGYTWREGYYIYQGIADHFGVAP
ncbi:MAG TPA: N-acetylmuramoyl-L-alanine amidase [Firmicutes bacterium]|nr:N-acetylmuramoyl-L-alanine amidase [Bacillota bacterium]